MSPPDKLKVIFSIWKGNISIHDASLRYKISEAELKRLCKLAWSGANAFIEKDDSMPELRRILK